MHLRRPALGHPPSGPLSQPPSTHKETPAAFRAGLEQQVEVPGFEIHAYEHPPGHRLPWHVHEVPVLVVVCRGGYTQWDARRSFDCRSGEMAVVPAAESTRELVGANGAHSLLIWPSTERARQIESCTDLLSRAAHFTRPFVHRIGSTLADELATLDGCATLAIESAVLELVSTATRSRESMGRGAPPAWLVRARTLICDRFLDGLSLAEIAAGAGVSRSQLARGFRAWLSVSPGGYLRQKRLEFAADRLRRSTDSVADIALTSGFYDQSHLSNAFRRAYGFTPGDYRRAHGGD